MTFYVFFDWLATFSRTLVETEGCGGGVDKQTK